MQSAANTPQLPDRLFAATVVSCCRHVFSLLSLPLPCVPHNSHTPTHTHAPPPTGLIFVAYCVVCYLVTALLFSLLILDLAALVITLAPSKTIFKYTDLVYTGNNTVHTCVGV